MTKTEIVATALKDAEPCPSYYGQHGCDGLTGCSECCTLAALAVLEALEDAGVAV